MQELRLEQLVHHRIIGLDHVVIQEEQELEHLKQLYRHGQVIERL